MDIQSDLAELAETRDDPFRRDEEVARLLSHPTAERLLAGGKASAARLVEFIRGADSPPLVSVAVILLSRLDPGVYPTLIDLTATLPRPAVEAFETGLWMFPVPEEQIARDLVQAARTSGAPNPLLLLQRPAARTVHAELASIAAQQVPTASLFALWALAHGLQPADAPLLERVIASDDPATSAQAGLLLLQLGNLHGLAAIENGLSADDPSLRTHIYAGIRGYLPQDIEPRYDPAAPSRAAVEALIQVLRNQYA